MLIIYTILVLIVLFAVTFFYYSTKAEIKVLKARIKIANLRSLRNKQDKQDKQDK